MLEPAYSRKRQKRLLDRMAELKLDAVAVGWPQHVYYLGAFWTGWLHQSAFVLFSDGRSWMVTANAPAKNVSADEVVSYEAQWNATQRQEQPAVVGQLVTEALKSRGAARIGIDASIVSSQVSLQSDAELVPIDPVLWGMRRVKDDDELALMKQAIRCTQAMYERARQIIEPGILETRVFGELHAAAVETAGEPLTAHLGNDYQCGSGGGPPRKGRAAKDGELYILDLGPCYRGYFADNSRVFAVNRKPTDAQVRAWETVKQVFGIVESMAKPGAHCRDIYAAVDQHFSLQRGKGMPHHLGHGVGLQPHEYPHLNPAWDDVLQEGEIFTAEPGVYGAELAAGIRLENQYRVTRDGVENLTKFPLEMVLARFGYDATLPYRERGWERRVPQTNQTSSEPADAESWFRAPTRRERWIAAALFAGFGAFFVMLFLLQAGWWFRWVILGLGVFSLLHGARHAIDAVRRRYD